MLYEMLTGYRAFMGENAALLMTAILKPQSDACVIVYL
jgi:hypothetical protein